MRNCFFKGLTCFLFLLFSINTASALTQSRTVTVTGGKINGLYNGSIAEFKGIPYAAPPTGSRRLKGPQNVIPWSGTKYVHHYESACYANSAMLQFMALEPPSEDCLYLNVFTPKYRRSSEKQPVMVFIHGGALEAGSGGIIYNPEYLVDEGDLIVVTINYRVGNLGFAWHNSLNNTESGPVKGNYGFRDQIKALEWVQDNIAKFGGNPNNVTIFGQSGGAWSVCNLIASPMAAGLFHKAIIQSGGAIAEPPSRAHANTEDLIYELGCSGGSDQQIRDCLQSKSAMDFVRASENLCTNSTGLCQPSAVIDGHFLEDHPLKVIEAGDHNRVPVMLGSTDDELPSFFFAAFTWNQWKESIEKVFTDPADASLIRSWYNKSNFGTYNNALGNLMTDMGFRYPMRAIATALYNNQSQEVYHYEFHFPNPAIATIHASDLFYIFANPTPLLPLSYDLHFDMLERWTHFATSGNPNPYGLGEPYWAPFNTSDYGRYHLGNLLYMEYPTYDPGSDILGSMDKVKYPVDPEGANLGHMISDLFQDMFMLDDRDFPDE